MIDCRFLPNPHWVDELRPLPGTDERVRTYVRGQQTYREFMRRLRSLLGFMVPGFVAEGKSYLTVAVGCTGGRHRSVVVDRGPRAASSATRVFRPRSTTATSIAEVATAPPHGPNAVRAGRVAIGYSEATPLQEDAPWA